MAAVVDGYGLESQNCHDVRKHDDSFMQTTGASCVLGINFARCEIVTGKIKPNETSMRLNRRVQAGFALGVKEMRFAHVQN